LNSTELETSILAILFLHHGYADRIFAVLEPEDFTTDARAQMYDVARELWGRHVELDAVSAVYELRDRGVENAAELLEDWTHWVGTPTNLDYYLDCMISARTRREVRVLCRQIIDPEVAAIPLEKQVEGFRALIDTHEARLDRRQALGPDAVLGQMDAFVHEYDEAKGGSAFETGFWDIDQRIKLLPGMHVLAGRPGMGKTSLAYSIAIGLMRKCHVLLVPLEANAPQVAMSLLANDCRIPVNGILHNSLDEADRMKLDMGRDRFKDMSFSVHRDPSLEAILAAMKTAVREHPKVLAVVDYLQLMETTRKIQSREQEVSYFARRLHNVGQELGIPVLAMSQLNRQVEGSGDQRPKLSHLRESGSIEQQAQSVMLLYREDYYTQEEKGTENSTVEVHVAKNRYGPTGKFEMMFQRPFLKFTGIHKGGGGFDNGSYVERTGSLRPDEGEGEPLERAPVEASGGSRRGSGVQGDLGYTYDPPVDDGIPF